jgi:hypothetical protein
MGGLAGLVTDSVGLAELLAEVAAFRGTRHITSSSAIRCVVTGSGSRRGTATRSPTPKPLNGIHPRSISNGCLQMYSLDGDVTSFESRIAFRTHLAVSSRCLPRNGINPPPHTDNTRLCREESRLAHLMRHTRAPTPSHSMASTRRASATKRWPLRQSRDRTPTAVQTPPAVLPGSAVGRATKRPRASHDHTVGRSPVRISSPTAISAPLSACRIRASAVRSPNAPRSACMGCCRGAAKINKTRLTALTRLGRVAGAC